MMFDGPDEDYAFALKLQQELDNEELNHAVILTEANGNAISNANLDTSTMTLVDPRWEMIDPLPDIRALFIEFNAKYFWSKLEGIEVRWSPRMTLCAGLCVYEGHGGLCSVRLSQPLLKLRPRKDLIETLLHEMIHAYLFVTDNNRDHDGHGPEFHKHMHRLNAETGTKISVYHTFHDEVDNYRQHWWRCDGPCRNKTPYFGYVKRSMNRAPAPRDTWWAEHQKTCGGSYAKIKEPEGYGIKKKTAKEEKTSEKPKGNLDIRSFAGQDVRTGPTSSATNTKPRPTESTITNGMLQHTGPSKSGSAEKQDYSSKLLDADVRKNIHGFGGMNSQTEITRLHEDCPNIHGLGQPRDTTRMSDNVTTLKNPFSGSAKSLGGNWSTRDGAIIRRIPGIGVITSERHLQNKPTPANMTQAVDNEVPAASNFTSDQTQDRSSDKALHKTDKAVVDYDSEESDFDNFLEGLLKPDFKRKKRRKIRGEMPVMSSTKRIPGFTSVSNKSRISDPKKRYSKGDSHKLPVVSKSRKIDDFLQAGSSKSKPVTPLESKVKRHHEIRGGESDDNILCAEPAVSVTAQYCLEQTPGDATGHMTRDQTNSSSHVINKLHAPSQDYISDDQSDFKLLPKSNERKPVVKRKMPDEFALDRYKRAANGLSSDSDPDIDESMTLSSVMKHNVNKLRAQSPMKKLKLSDMNCDGEDSLITSLPLSSTGTLSTNNHIPSTTSGVHNQAVSYASTSPSMINCPVCRVKVPEAGINDHLDLCLLVPDF